MPTLVPLLLVDPSPAETTTMVHKATIPQEIREQLMTAARRAATHEACGVLLGREETRCVHIETFIEAVNVAASPRTAYEVSAEALLDAHRQGHVIGVFHTHPRGKAEPSATDEALAQAGWIYLIAGTDGLRGFLALEGRGS